MEGERAMTINIFELYNELSKKDRELSGTTMLCMTFKAFVDYFIEQNNLIDALLQNNRSCPLVIKRKFLDYRERAQSHVNMMTYQIGDELLKIFTFAHND